MKAVSWPWNLIIGADPLGKAALLVLALVLAVGIAALPVPFAAAAVLGPIALVLLLVRPEVGLLFLAFSVPYGSLKEGSTGGFDLAFTEPLVVLVAAIWLIRGVRERRIVVDSAPLYLPLFLFLGLIAYSLTTAPSLALSAKELIKWVALLVAYVFVVNNVRSRRVLALLIALLFLAAISEALLGLFQFVMKVGPKGFITGSFLRAYGTFGQPNPYAGYLAIVVAPAFGLALFSLRLLGRTRPTLSSAQKWLLLLAWVTLGLGGAAIYASLSRGAWLGLAASVGVITALSSRRALWIMVALLVILAIFLSMGLLQLLPAQITDRILDATKYFGVFDATKVKLTFENWPIVERMAMWQAAWNMFQDNPIFGVGIGNYAVAYPDYRLPLWKEPKGHAHNIYLNMLAEMGIIGLIAYLALMATFFVHGVRVLRRLSRSSELQFERYLVIGLLGSLVVLTAHNFFDNLFVHGIGVQIGVILGLIFVLDRLGRESGSAEPVRRIRTS